MRRRLAPLIRPLFVAAAFAVGLAGCSNKLDQAAKARVFSPEDPAPDVQRAAEPLNVVDAATDGALWDRLWRMDRLEVTHRIGAHRAHGTVHFKWTLGDKQVELNEDQLLETDAQGQFHATVTNDQGSGFEFIWLEGKAYARGRYGAFHERRTDRAQQDTVREQATSALRTVYSLFQRRLSGVSGGQTTRDGREATRFSLTLGAPRDPAPEEGGPAPVYGKTSASGPLGPDVDTAHRLAFDKDEQPERVSGDIVVDASGVIVKCSLRARFSMREAPNQPAAMLDVDVAYELEPKAAVAITVPRDVISLKLPHVVNDPLWFTRSASASASASHDDEEERDNRDDDSRDDEGSAGAHPAKPAAAKP